MLHFWDPLKLFNLSSALTYFWGSSVRLAKPQMASGLHVCVCKVFYPKREVIYLSKEGNVMKENSGEAVDRRYRRIEIDFTLIDFDDAQVRRRLGIVYALLYSHRRVNASSKNLVERKNDGDNSSEQY